MKDQSNLTRQEYEEIKKWQEKHKDADELIYHAKSKLPVCAIYSCPIGEHYATQRAILKKISKLVWLSEDEE